MNTVAVLFAARNSVYKRLDGVDVYDADRDALTFAGGCPVVAHPPCRAWSAYTAHQAKVPDGERELGLWACDTVRRCGGILEQPAHSRLFDAAGLAKPGEGIDEVGGWSLAVWQAWWGYPMKKATWLYFVGIPQEAVDVPFRLHPRGLDRRRQQLMSRNERAATCEALAVWLVELARSAESAENSACTDGENI